MKLYDDIGDGWLPVPKDLNLACCDCWLVHEIRFRVRMVKKEPKLEWKIERDNRATAQLRRNRKAACAVRK